mgnify:CR=1 FL=1
MNKVILMGRLTRDPEIRYSQGNDQMAIARYTLAVDRRFNRNGDQTAEGAETRTTESSRPISSTVWPLTARASSPRSISVRA